MADTTPSFLVLLFFLSIWVLVVRKEKIIVPLIIAMCFLPADISLKIGTLDFTAIRVIAFLGLLKIYFSGDHGRLEMNTIDKLFILYNVFGSIIYFISSYNKFGAFILKSGACVDSIILYIVLRNAIYTKDDIRLIIKTFSICVIILLPFAMFEFYSANNLFAILGRSAISLRNGEIRTATTFSHSILFGSFAAAIIPILYAEYKIKPSIFKLLSISCCIFFVYASSSSGPIIVLMGVIFFLIFFKWKQYGSSFAWFMLATATFIHFIRNNPLWYFLYVGIKVKDSSTGWHRVLLMDAAVKEFWNWWLLGYGDLGPQWHTKYWPYNHAKFTDVTNHYLLEGVRGGFFTMILFVFLCFKVIKTLGSFSISQNEVKDQWLWWGFTVMMIAHCITFLSVAYFGQITMLLYLTIAVAAFAHDESNKAIQENTLLQ